MQVVKGIVVENGTVTLNSDFAPPLNNPPKFLNGVEQIKVEPIKNETLIVGAPFLQAAKTLVDFFANKVFPDPEKVSAPKNVTLRIGKGLFSLTPSDNVMILTYSRFNGDTENPVFYRGRWILNHIRAYTFARAVLKEMKNRSFTYKISDTSLLMKDENGYKIINLNSGAPLTLLEREVEYLRSCIDEYLLSGVNATSRYGRLAVVSPGVYRIGPALINTEKINDALFLRELM